MQKNFNSGHIGRLTRIAVVGALYVLLTLLIAPVAYGPVQFRFSEVLMLLCFFNPEYIVSMILGCALANLFSPIGYVDVIFGTLATAVAAVAMYRCKNIYIASIFSVISNGIIIGLELFLVFGEPLILSMATVAFGEFMVVSVVGVALFKFLLMRYAPFMRIIKTARH